MGCVGCEGCEVVRVVRGVRVVRVVRGVRVRVVRMRGYYVCERKSKGENNCAGHNLHSKLLHTSLHMLAFYTVH